MCLKPTPLPTLSPCPTRRASARHIARLINASKSPSPSAKRAYSSSSPARSYLPRKCSDSSIWKSGSGAASPQSVDGFNQGMSLTTFNARFKFFSHKVLRAQRFSERRQDVILFSLGHLRIKRQKQ